MSPPTWLPPLNSHQVSCTSVLASQFDKPRKIPSLTEAVFVIFIRVSVQFFSQDTTNPRAFDGLYLQEKHYIPCCRITGSSAKGKQRILAMFSRMRLPFQLKDIVFKESNHLGEDSEPRVWDDMNSLAEKIRNFLCNRRSYNPDQNLLAFELEIEKVIEIPEFEHRAWALWYDEKKRIDPDFERDYMEAISRPRTSEELLQEALDVLTFKAATRSSIEGLKDVILDEYSSTTNCLICLEDLPIGSKISGMPCSHIFHGDCIVEWLQRSHMCPLCRFELPYFVVCINDRGEA